MVGAQQQQQQQQQQPHVGFAWLLPALGNAASAGCQFVCPQWANGVGGQPIVQREEQAGQLVGFSTRATPRPFEQSWSAGLPPLFTVPPQDQPDQILSGHSVQRSASQREAGPVVHKHGSPGRQGLSVKRIPIVPTPRRSWGLGEDEWSLDSCDTFSSEASESCQGERPFAEDLSESNPSSEGSQQTGSSALEV